MSTYRDKNCDVKFVLLDTKSSFLLSIESILRFGLYIVHSIYGCKFTRIFSSTIVTVHAVSSVSVLLDFVILDEWLGLDTAEFLKTRLNLLLASRRI